MHIPPPSSASRTLPWLLLAVAAALAGCAADPAVIAAADEQVCTREAPTGSSIPVTRCRSRAQVERERKDAETYGTEIRRANVGAADKP